MDRLDQLFARSKREIEAHTDELADTETGRYFIDEASQLFAALRLWAQLRANTGPTRSSATSSKPATPSPSTTWPVSCEGWEARTGGIASRSVKASANKPASQLLAIASYALRACGCEELGHVTRPARTPGRGASATARRGARGLRRAERRESG